MQLKALKAFRYRSPGYQTRMLRPGDVFEASDSDGRLLIGVRRAEPHASEPVKAKPRKAAPKPAPEPAAETAEAEEVESENGDIESAADTEGEDERSEADQEHQPDALDGSVAALVEYLATVDSAEEIDALIAAEKAGKTRKGAIAALEERRAAL